MKILLVSATSSEVEATVKMLDEEKYINDRLTGYLYNNCQVDVLIPGVGMVATTYWLVKTLATFHYDLVINAGICGSFHRSLEPGMTVNVIEDSFPELVAESGDRILTLDELNLLGKDEFPFSDGKLINDLKIQLPTLSVLPKVKGVTVNTVHGNKFSIASLLKRIDADIETMEGAAIFYVCKNEQTQCIQLKAVSNYIEPRDTSKWSIPLAIFNLNERLVLILKECLVLNSFNIG
jgi:futalosine hydrolase